VIRPIDRFHPWLRAACIALASCALGPAPRALAESPCTAWAGEFDPLPTVADADPLRARWARMRVDQLSALATRAESHDRGEAGRLWQRVRCLEPDSAAAAAGIERARATAVSEAPPRTAPEPAVRETPKPRPRAEARAEPKPEPRKTGPSAAKKAEPAPEAATPQSVAAPLDHTEKMIRAARFDDALGELERLRPEAQRPEERARLEVLAATAQVAFGDETAARKSIERALRANPKLALDERTTSPKLLRVFDDARAVIAAPPYEPAASKVTPVAEPGQAP
jgi:hypothetical protein